MGTSAFQVAVGQKGPITTTARPPYKPCINCSISDEKMSACRTTLHGNCLSTNPPKQSPRQPNGTFQIKLTSNSRSNVQGIFEEIRVEYWRGSSMSRDKKNKEVGQWDPRSRHNGHHGALMKSLVDRTLKAPRCAFCTIDGIDIDFANELAAEGAAGLVSGDDGFVLRITAERRICSREKSRNQRWPYM